MICPRCGNPMFRMPFKIVDLETNQEYIVYRCTNCGDEVLVPKTRTCGRKGRKPGVN